MAAPDAPQAAAKPEAAAAEAHGLSVSAQPGRLSTAYDVGKAVGKGGYAVVYKGVRKEDGRIIAVKKVEVGVAPGRGVSYPRATCAWRAKERACKGTAQVRIACVAALPANMLAHNIPAGAATPERTACMHALRSSR